MAKSPLELALGDRPQSVLSRPTAFAGAEMAQRTARTMSRFSLNQNELESILGTTAKLSSFEAQSRLADMLTIVDSVRGWTKTDDEALNWYRSEPIPAFGNATPADLVRQGMSSTVRDYIEHLTVGGYA